MNKKIKIIELVNKIKNGKEIPQKIRFENKIYKYCKKQQDYIFYNDEDEFYGETLLFNIMSFHFISELLETEIEILEDNTEEIEELEKEEESIANPITMMQEVRFYYDSKKMGDKINELVKAVNQLRKEKE